MTGIKIKDISVEKIKRLYKDYILGSLALIVAAGIGIGYKTVYDASTLNSLIKKPTPIETVYTGSDTIPPHPDWIIQASTLSANGSNPYMAIDQDPYSVWTPVYEISDEIKIQTFGNYDSNLLINLTEPTTIDKVILIAGNPSDDLKTYHVYASNNPNDFTVNWAGLAWYHGINGNTTIHIDFDEPTTAQYLLITQSDGDPMSIRDIYLCRPTDDGSPQNLPKGY